MSKKKPKPYDVLPMCRELAKISTMANTNYNTVIDATRVEAAELVIKHSADEKLITGARDALVAIAGDGAILPQHRVRAIKVLLEGQRAIQVIDAISEEVES